MNITRVILKTMNRTPRISEAEWEIMKICWGRSPITAREIIETLSASDNWHPKTAKTLLNRLIKKRALGFQKEGRAYLYEPLIAEKDCVTAESNSFLDRVFGGSLKPMLAHFVENRRLSPGEIAELKVLIKQQEKK
jgi:BlaI family transcriptional regulator, penicillinase repressor